MKQEILSAEKFDLLAISNKWINAIQFPVYTMEQWRKDGSLKLQVGQLIDENVFFEMRDCMLPHFFKLGIFQPGEAYDHDAENGQPLYMTFKKTSNGWQYMGICRTGETVQRVGYCSQFLAV